MKPLSLRNYAEETHLQNMIQQMEVRFYPTKRLCLKLQYLLLAFLTQCSFPVLPDIPLDMQARLENGIRQMDV